MPLPGGIASAESQSKPSLSCKVERSTLLIYTAGAGTPTRRAFGMRRTPGSSAGGRGAARATRAATCCTYLPALAATSGARTCPSPSWRSWCGGQGLRSPADGPEVQGSGLHTAAVLATSAQQAGCGMPGGRASSCAKLRRTFPPGHLASKNNAAWWNMRSPS